MPEIELLAIRVHQSIGDLYLGVMNGGDLYAVAKSDRLRMEELRVPKYVGFQRALSPDRVAAIRDYLQTPRSTFPNAIILSIDSDSITEWQDVPEQPGLSRLRVDGNEGAVTIIDGQHRAAALDAAPAGFQVVVTFFVDAEIIRKAEIFAKINSTQKAVNPSIAFQLFGYSDDRSPQRTAHEIADTLNTTEGSPFFRRLRMLGTKDGWAKGRLSQSTFCKELMKLYSRKPAEDENRILRGDALESYPSYPMRTWFIDAQDQRILETVWKFFFRVASTWADEWADVNGEFILTKTTGYAAWMEVIKKWLLHERAHEVLNDQGVAEALGQIANEYRQPNRTFVRAHYPAGNQGKILLRDALLTSLHLV